MKNISKLLSLSFLLAAVLWSCEKDENKIYLEGGTAPVLTGSISIENLTIADAAKEAAVFTWTNPNYNFTTGISSQDVNYLLQVDTAGANFTSPSIQEVSIARDLSIVFTVKELNTILTKLNLQENMLHNLEFRIKATLVNNSVPLYSNVIQSSITPYLDVAVPVPPTGELYITGDGTPSGWTNNPPTGQQCTKASTTEYYIVMNFTPGFYYKFLSTLTQWQPQYGGPSATGGDLGYNLGLPGQSDPSAIPTPSLGGLYKVTINFKTGKYTVAKQ